MTARVRREHVVVAPERLDLDTCDAFRATAADLIDAFQEGRGRLVVDMQDTRYLDSAGLQALIMVRRRATSAGHVIRLLAPTEEIRAILVLTRTDQLFEIEEAEPA